MQSLHIQCTEHKGTEHAYTAYTNTVYTEHKGTAAQCSTYSVERYSAYSVYSVHTVVNSPVYSVVARGPGGAGSSSHCNCLK